MTVETNSEKEEGSEDEILKDFNISPILREFTLECALQKLDQNLDVLNRLENPLQIVESVEYSRMIFEIIMSSSLNLLERSQVWDKFRLNDRYKIVVDVYITLLNGYKSLDFDHTKPEPQFAYCYNKMTLNEFKLLNTSKLALCVNNLLAAMIEVRKYSIKRGILQALVKVIDNNEFINKMISYDYDFIGFLAFNINWLSKIAEAYKSLWHELDAINVLMKASKNFAHVSLYLYMASANIAYDKEIESLTEFHELIDVFVEMVNRAAVDERKLVTKQEFIDDDDNKIYEFDVISVLEEHNNAMISVTGLMLSLYRLSVNNKIKYELFHKPGLKDSLKKFIIIGNDIERQYATQLLCQLSFDDRVNQELRTDEELIQNIKNILLKRSEIVYKKLIKSCEQLIWLLSEKKDNTKEENGGNTEHVMISYNAASRELCLRIKEYLETCGIRVWIDVNEIHGSSLESMARAVENSKCVLVCVTEKYRQSVNCQAEAQYAFRLNKKIIPLIMQKGYANVDGWLGFIIGDKIFIDFTKYEYDFCVKKLVNQINLLTKNVERKVAHSVGVMSLQRTAVPTLPQDECSFTTRTVVPTCLLNIDEPTPVLKQTQINEAEGWDDSRVKTWLKDECDIGVFYEILKPLNGKILYQLYLLQIHTPEFFYKSITKNDSVDLKLVALFSSSLRELFK